MAGGVEAGAGVGVEEELAGVSLDFAAVFASDGAAAFASEAADSEAGSELFEA